MYLKTINFTANKNITMKKFLLLLLLQIILFNSLFAQEIKPKPFKIFKFLPFSLITGSLTMSQEKFNTEKNRSTILTLGLRYIKTNQEATNYSSTSQKNIEQFNKWNGGMMGIERRFYVPSFKSGEKNSFFNERTQFGLYLSTGLRLDYNSNEYDKSTYNYVYDQSKPNTQTGILEVNKAKINYLGVMPNMNIGMQFTLFQNLYIDTFLGGGLRFINKKIVSKTQSGNYQSSYFRDNLQISATENFMMKEGVQANFGFSLGLKF